MFKSFTSTTTMFGLFWIMALILPTRVSASPCFLCQDHHKTPSRTDCLLDPGTGKTCFDLYTQLLMNENWSECLEYRHAYQDVCCGDDPENICYTGPTAAPVYKGDTGDQPTCKICSTEVRSKDSSLDWCATELLTAFATLGISRQTGSYFLDTIYRNL